MAQPTPAAPAPAAPATPQPADPKAAAKAPEIPPSPAPAKAEDGAPTAPEAKKPAAPANQVEADLMAAYGDDWEKMPQKVKDRVIAAEMKSREADKRMQLAAKLKKDLDMTNAQIGQLFDALRKDPWRVLSNPALGHDTRKLAEEYVWQMIQEQNRSPAEREAMRLKMENEEMKAADARRIQEQKDREFQATVDQRRAYWEKTIPEAIDGAGLPKTSYTVRRFAEYVKAAAKARMPADMPAIAAQIKQELIDLQSRFLLPGRLANETDEQFEDRVLASAPNEFVKMLRKADIRRLRAKGALPKPGPKPAAAPAQPTTKKKTMSEWLAERDARLGR